MKHGGDRKTNQDANWHVDRAEAAELLNVGTRTVARAKKVLDKGSPDLIEAAQSGRISVSAADVAELPKEEQVEIVARGEREILEAAKQIRI